MTNGKSILFVEPDRELRKAMSRILDSAGYDVVIAGDGMEALNVLSYHTVDLIISALRMPNLDGIELMREINRTKVHAPVIFITAYGDVESYMDVMNMGAFEYLNKPIRAHEILQVAGKAFGQYGEAHRLQNSSRIDSFS